MKQLAKNTVIYTLANLLPQGVAFLLLPIYTQYLSPEQYGIVNAMFVIQTFLTVFFSLSLDRSILRIYWDYKEKEDTFWGTITISLLLISTICFFISLLLKPVLELLFKEISFYPYYFFTIVTTFAVIFSLVPKSYFRLKNKAGSYLIVSSVDLLINISFILYFIIHAEEDALGVIRGKMIASLILLPFFVALTIRFIKMSFNFQILKNCLTFSLPIIPTLISAWILGQADRIFIAEYFSLSDVGIFSLSKKIGGIIGLISSAFAMAYHPFFFELANNKNKERIDKLYNINNIYISIIILVGFVLSFLSKELIYIFLDKKYFEAYLYIPPIVLTGVVGSISSTVFGAFIQQSKRMSKDMQYSLIVSILTFISYFIFIKAFGLVGSIISGFLSSLILFLLLYDFVKKECFFVEIAWKKILSLSTFVIVLILFFNYIIILEIYVSLLIKTVIILGIFTYLLYKNLHLLKLFLSGSKKPY